MQVRYLTQLNTKPRILKWYTPGELVFVMAASFIPFVIEVVIGVPPSLLTVGVMWILLTAIIIGFRVGKPEGYLIHLIKSYYTPNEFRVGGDVSSPMNYPVAKLYEDRDDV